MLQLLYPLEEDGGPVVAVETDDIGLLQLRLLDGIELCRVRPVIVLPHAAGQWLYRRCAACPPCTLASWPYTLT